MGSFFRSGVITIVNSVWERKSARARAAGGRASERAGEETNETEGDRAVEKRARVRERGGEEEERLEWSKCVIQSVYREGG